MNQFIGDAIDLYKAQFPDVDEAIAEGTVQNVRMAVLEGKEIAVTASTIDLFAKIVALVKADIEATQEVA